MADTAHPGGTGGTRRDFLTLTTIAVGAVGAATVVWPLINSMNPAADALAVASTEIDISKIADGQRVTFVYRGKPVFVAHRTAAEIEEARKVPLSDLIDPETDQARVKKADWLVVIGVCTHLGCVPLGQKATDPRGEWGGYFCPCHGSQYDTSGRVRHGPAPANLAVPPYVFASDSLIKVG